VGDKEKLGQLFLNLIQNAIQAVPKKGKIVLESRVLAQGEVLEVSIVDDGSGIPEDYRSRVFDPFFTTKDGGTGLGLSICHTIVEQHQGSINIECGEETGTRVSVRLPVKQDEIKGV
ncbi:MAG: ATP-binding protein, partial [Chloroflexota bacterium]